MIGATDCGKSTYSNFLLTSLSIAGAALAFVDADVGQKDVGPPATITLARFEGEAGLAHSLPSALYFVGNVHPVGNFLPMVVGTRRMADAADADFVVINTPGLVEGPGRVLNAFQIESLRPDAIVAIQRERELEPTLRPYAAHRIFRLRPSRKAAVKSRAQRRLARAEAFRAYFADVRDSVLDVRRLGVQRAPVFIGEPFPDPHFAYAEKTAEGVVAIGDATKAPTRQWRILPPDFADHLLCGVVDARGECRGLGILQHIDFKHGRIRLRTPVARRRIRALQFGELYLTRDGEELDRSPPGLS